MEFTEVRPVALGQRTADTVLKNALVVNVFTGEIVAADVAIVGDTIAGIGRYEGRDEIDCTGRYVVPGFIDAHMHIESTLALPAALAPALLAHGTTTVIADAHELVNVLGASGIDFILDQARGLPLTVCTQLASSVPATPFETNGAEFTVDDMRRFVGADGVMGLGEVMCYPDVIAGAPHIVEKLRLTRDVPRDGHAPGMTGKDLQTYIAAGIMTDHESSTWDEALEKVRSGLTVLIREGSAARNLEAIVTGLVASGISTEHFAFCTDDKHYSDIVTEGHIDHCVRKAVALGLPATTAVAMASLHAARRYGLNDRGAIAPGYRADLMILSDLDAVAIDDVYAGGVRIDRGASVKPPRPDETFLTTVHLPALDAERLRLAAHDTDDIIGIVPGELLTEHLVDRLPQADGVFVPDAETAKLVVVERHGRNGNVAVAPVRGYGLHGAAIATSVAHDSHNVLALGDNDEDILAATARLGELQGGYVLASRGRILGEVPLPVAGLLSLEDGATVQAQLDELRDAARALGVPVGVDPLITLSFLALPVIPHLRLSDEGLFDVDAFALIHR